MNNRNRETYRSTDGKNRRSPGETSGQKADTQISGLENPTSIAVFLIRHWGVLILAVGCLIIYSAYDAAIRVPVLVAASAEKFAIGLLVFFGPVKRTNGMTVTAIVDGIFAILYVVCLVG